MKVKLDLAEKRGLIFTEAIQLVKNNKAVKIEMADIKCCLNNDKYDKYNDKYYSIDLLIY